MHQLDLPAPGLADAPAFRDPSAAAAWLARQPLAQPAQMQAALQEAIAAVDASDIAAADRLGILDRLRSAVILAQSALEPRYSRKPLPLPVADAALFSAARRLWRTLAVAYLRIVPQLPPAEAVVPLHRGAVALRVEQYAHFLAAYELPEELMGLLYGVLQAAESLGVQQVPQTDADYKHIHESHIAGQVAWAFLLQFADPYHLSMAQLTVANRAFSRWRELAGFRNGPDEDLRARTLPLTALAGEVAAGRWLDVRPVARKIRKRIEALEAGEAPEALKLGRELSSTACIRLLHQLDEALRPGAGAPARETGSLGLVVGVENIYALLAGERLDPGGGKPSRTVNHQRMEIFGFDNLVTPVGAQRRVKVPAETWQSAQGQVSRAAEAGTRLLSPCLAARELEPGQAARLCVLEGLHMSPEDRLQGWLRCYPAPVQAASIQAASQVGAEARLPVFVLGTGQGLSVVLPAAAGLRPGSRLNLEGTVVAPVMLGEVLERGSDFVRYAAMPQ
ncbi:MAG: hypothetical protein H6R10_2645 [Rhodocyclaceae bacterium]|nr:hypothetical protein [Rhodocyclaceae bacterium]